MEYKRFFWLYLLISNVKSFMVNRGKVDTFNSTRQCWEHVGQPDGNDCKCQLHKPTLLSYSVSKKAFQCVKDLDGMYRNKVNISQGDQCIFQHFRACLRMESKRAILRQKGHFSLRKRSNPPNISMFLAFKRI